MVTVRWMPVHSPVCLRGAVGEGADALKALTPVVSDFNSSVWKLKKDSGLSLKSPISNISIPPELSMLEDSLVRMHSIE